MILICQWCEGAGNIPDPTDKRCVIPYRKKLCGVCLGSGKPNRDPKGAK